jgi:hypothetical protein
MARRSFANQSADMGEAWKEYGRAQQQRRASRLPGRQEEIRALRGKGFTVEEKNGGYHFRIDSALDLFPIHQRFHALKANQRGNYQNPVTVAMRFLRGAK